MSSVSSQDVLAERLLKKDKDHHHDFHRRRHHRRANKRGRRPHRPPHQHQQQQQQSHPTNPPPVDSPNSSTGALVDSKRFLVNNGRKLVLRPTKGPLLNAPKNSTQFIIDDHESPPFLTDADADADDAEESGNSAATNCSSKKYNTRSRSSSRRVSATEEASCVAEKSQNTPGNYVVNDDDYTLWAEFSERDFQKVYESAHQEQVADWDRQRLIEEITSLEKKQKELVGILAKVDPEMYAQQLQDQLVALQEKNALLKGQINGGRRRNKSDSASQSPDSSTKE